MLGVAMACQSPCVKGEDATRILKSCIRRDVFYVEYAHRCPARRQAAGFLDEVPAFPEGEMGLQGLHVAPVFDEDQP